MKRFVVVGDERKGQVGEWAADFYNDNTKFAELIFEDRKAIGIPLTDLREIDDSAIAAGDEVVAIDGHVFDVGTVATVTEATEQYLFFDGNGTNGSGWWRSHFVKVKPLPLPEVIHEAAEPERPDPNETLVKQIWQRLNAEQGRNRSYHCADDILKVLDSVLEHKHSKVVDTINSARLFQEDVLSFLRAFSLILETIGDGHTHREKEARLRGLISLVETAATRLRERQMSDLEGLSYRMLDDVFRSDFPVRHFVDKARESDARATAAEKWLGAVKGVLTAEQVASLEREQGSEVPF